MTNEPQRGIDGLPAPLLRHAEQVCCQFESAWKAGNRPAIEAYLAGLLEPERTALLHELIEIEADYRQRAGDCPRPEDYSGRFPGLDTDWLADALATSPGLGSAVPGTGPALGAAWESRSSCAKWAAGAWA